ncbi:MAG: retroviral-like aspartic protease family protein [Thiomonas arsenitoxydans]|uniref:Retroviral-like aspartic protease family protein n=1 Tax=Thiomonas arsenitoxydans (strain DSM 22701 / CIP 110005 / 3As) TaxID=426114 RepID=A0A8I1SVA1_THIA3|nr:retropepsin-like aspartic protease [Thiomonas arsenitoxydans]MBN8745445.1 retroviral-like aspartic protease family protein [Thiomonas arsenitoxydans]
MIIAWLAIGGLVYLAVLHFVPGFAPPKVSSEGANELLLRADWSGGYDVAGSINGVPVKFMIDTGASTVSISQEMARQMGIQGCMGGVSSTANGNVPICMATAKTLVFGPFEAQNVRVAVLPRLEGRALLGMNVLSVLHITQSDGKMVIAAPGR